MSELKSVLQQGRGGGWEVVGGWWESFPIDTGSPCLQLPFPGNTPESVHEKKATKETQNWSVQRCPAVPKLSFAGLSMILWAYSFCKFTDVSQDEPGLFPEKERGEGEYCLVLSNGTSNEH